MQNGDQRLTAGIGLSPCKCVGKNRQLKDPSPSPLSYDTKEREKKLLPLCNVHKGEGQSVSRSGGNDAKVQLPGVIVLVQLTQFSLMLS